MNTFVFHGTLTALQPLTVTIKGTPGGRLPRNGGPDAPAYWPATTIRGSLRHAAHRVALMFQQDNGLPRFDLAEHFLLAQGVDIVGDVATPADGEIGADLSLREGNPLLSMFGLWGLASRTTIGPAFPLNKDSVGMFGGGARTIMFERTPELLEAIEPDQKERLNTILEEQSMAAIDISELKGKQQELKKAAKLASSEEKKAIFDQIAALNAEIQNRKDAKTEARESIRRPIDQYEAISAGTVMEHDMSLQSATDIELGFILATLLEFARNPRMGGHKAHNCGLVAGSWEVSTWPAKSFSPVVLGKVEFDAAGFRVEGERLHAAYESWCNAVGINFNKKAS